MILILLTVTSLTHLAVAQSWQSVSESGLVVFRAAAKNGRLYALGHLENSSNWNIYSWDSIGGWQLFTTLPAGLTSSSVQAQYVNGNSLYLAGQFTISTAEGQTVNIARLDLATKIWHTVGDGNLNAPVSAIVITSNGDVYVGGVGDPFTYNNPPNVDPQLLKKSTGGTSSWVTVGGAISGQGLISTGGNGVTALATDGQNVFIAGDIQGATNSSGQFISSPGIIKWTGTDWGGFNVSCVSLGAVTSVAVCGTNLFVAGSQNYSGPNFSIARFSIVTSQCLPTDGLMYFSGAGYGNELAVLDGVVYVAGAFDTVGYVDASGKHGLAARSIAEWVNDTWSPIGCTADGLWADAQGDVGNASELIADPDSHSIFVLGQFIQAGTVPVSAPSDGEAVARWFPPPTPVNTLTNGMVAWWPFDDSTVDVIGNHAGVLSGGVSGFCVWNYGLTPTYGFARGKVGDGLFCDVGMAIMETTNPWPCLFPGSFSAGRFTVNDAPDLNFPAVQNFTISGWIDLHSAEPLYPNLDSEFNNYHPILSKGSAYTIELRNGRVYFVMGDNQGHAAGVLEPSSFPDLTDNRYNELMAPTWHHIAVTVDRTDHSGGRMYVDGEVVATFDPTSVQGDITSSAPLIVGGAMVSFPLYYGGQPLIISDNPYFYPDGYDEIAIYNRALTPCEIWALRSQGAARLPGAPTTCFPTPAGLVSWWPMEGGIDIGPSGNNGYLSNNVPFIKGMVGQGMGLSSKPSGISVPDGTSLDFGAGADFSIDCWVSPIVASTSYGVMEMVSKRIVSGGATEGYELCLANGKVVFQMSSTLSSPLSAGWTGPDLRDGQWHHVAVTVQRSSTTGGQIYVDGTVISTFDPTSQPGSLGVSAALLIGMHPDPSLDCNFRGGMDEVALYNRALTSAEVQTLHNLGTRPSTGLVAWWQIEGSANDSAGANNGSFVSTASFLPGKVGNAVYITGKWGGIFVSNTASLNPGTGPFSIECWLQPTNVSTSYGVMEVVSKRIVSGGATEGYELCLANGQVVFQMAATLSSPLSAGWTGPDLRDGHWHHIAVTVDRGSTSGGVIYVDGQAIATFNPTSQPGDLGTTAPLLIGMHPDTSLDCNFRGGIDEVSIYSRPLTAAEVLSIYNAGSLAKCYPQ